MDQRTKEALQRGALAGLAGGVPQVLLTKIEEKLFLDGGEDADLGPRLIQRMAERMGKPLPEDVKWLAATAFHFAYAAAWGTLYAAASRRRPLHPLVGGLALGGLIYAITFPRWGGAVRTRTEPPPGARSARKEVVLATATFAFGLGTALAYGRGPGRPPLGRLLRP